MSAQKIKKEAFSVENEAAQKDYLTYPQGFSNLAEDLELPFESKEQREAYLWTIIDGLIKM